MSVWATVAAAGLLVAVVFSAGWLAGSWWTVRWRQQSLGHPTTRSVLFDVDEDAMKVGWWTFDDRGQAVFHFDAPPELASDGRKVCEWR